MLNSNAFNNIPFKWAPAIYANGELKKIMYHLLIIQYLLRPKKKKTYLCFHTNMPKTIRVGRSIFFFFFFFFFFLYADVRAKMFLGASFQQNYYINYK